MVRFLVGSDATVSSSSSAASARVVGIVWDEVKHKDEQIKALKNEATDQRGKIATLRSEVKSEQHGRLQAEKKLEESLCQIADLKTQIKQKEDEVETLKRDVEEKQRENVELHEWYNAEIEKVKEDAKAEVEEYKARIAAMEEELSQAKDSKRLAEDQLKELKMALREKECEHKKMIMANENEKLKLQLNLSNTQRRLSEVERDKLELHYTQRVSSLQEENCRLRSQVSDGAVPTSELSPDVGRSASEPNSTHD